MESTYDILSLLFLGGKALKNGADYTVSYPKNMKNVGSYTVQVNFKGSYRGAKKKAFVINPKGTSISQISGKKKAISLKWKKQIVQAGGYEISYSTDSKLSKKNTKVVYRAQE